MAAPRSPASMPTMIVRKATPEDVALASRDEPPGAQVAARHYARQEDGLATFLVARRGDEILGSCLVVLAEEVPDLRHLQVAEHARGGGVGTALIAASEEVARSLGYREIALGVGVDNRRAHALYRRLGYYGTRKHQRDTYTYVDAAGVPHVATETSELLRKSLGEQESKAR